MTRFSLLRFLRPLTRLFRRDATADTRRHRTVPRLESLEDRRVPSCNTISGFVYNDANANGLFDPGEKPIANSPIQLFNASGVVVGSTMTDANGHYEFDDDSTLSTAPTTLVRDLVFANAKTDFSQTQGLAQFNPALGTLTSVEIRNAGDLTSRIRAENVDSEPATITGKVSGTLTLSIPGLSPLVTSNAASESFPAAAFDGAMDFAGASGHDFGEKTASGSKSVTLTSAASLALFTGTGSVSVNESAHATSSATGAGNLLTQISSRAGAHVTVIYHYTPSNCLRAGNYKIVQTRQPAGFLDGKESRNGVVIPNTIGTDTISVVLANVNLVNNNFGEVRPVELCGSVYVDANNDGIKQSTERGIAGVTIRLTGTNDAGQTINLTGITKADGSYDFAGLRPGTYTLTETQPSGFLDGKDTIGTVPGTVLPDQFANIRVANGAMACNNNFGELQPASVSGHVYLDSNDDGIFQSGELPIPGTLVVLTGTDALGHTFTKSATTGLDGSYSFTDLRPGLYTVQEFQPAGFLDGKDTLGNLGGTKLNDLFFVALGSGQKGVDYNFGELLPPPPPQVIPQPPPPPPSTTPVSKLWLINF